MTFTMNFATREAPAFGLLGQTLDADTTTGQMLEKAGLADWNVRKHPLTAEYGDLSLPVEGQHVVVRDTADGPEALSIVGDRYHVVQNEIVFGWADNILDGGGTWYNAGALRGGRLVMGSLAIDREVVIDPGGVADKVQTYLIVVGSHDGSTPTTGIVSPMRLFCQNQLPSLRKAKQRFSIRHTASFSERLAQAREALNITFKAMDAWEPAAQALFQTDTTDAEFFSIVKALHPEPKEDATDAAKTRWENKVDIIQGIWKGNANQIEKFADAPDTMSGVTGTAWGALNALTEFEYWYRTARGGDSTTLLESASGLVPAGVNRQQAIMSTVREFAVAKRPKLKTLV